MFETDEFLELSEHDKYDVRKMETFLGDALDSCCNKRCNKVFPKDLVIKHRHAFMEMDKSSQDLVIMSHLQLLRRDQRSEDEYASQVVKDKSRFSRDCMSRHNIQYRFLDLPICKQMYLHLHSVCETWYKNVIKHFDKSGIASRTHGNIGNTPARDIFTHDNVEKVVSFIKVLAEKTAISLPSRLAQFKNFKAMK